jgi:pimeloyl-ACP methyl ester carboxylesterase
MIKGLLAAVGLVAVLAQQAPPGGKGIPDAPGMLVSIGEHRLFVSCGGPTGRGPTVVLEAGGGGSSGEWAMVREQLGPLVQDLARLSANSRFIRVEDSGHAIHRERPATVAQAIRDVRAAAVSGSRLAVTPR